VRTTRKRDENIALKEQEICELKRNNRELEMFKFVLDFQIKEYKRQDEPRENEIDANGHKEKELDVALEQYHRDKIQLESEISEMEHDIAQKQEAISLQRKRTQVVNRTMQNMCNDMYNLVQQIQNPSVLKLGLKQFYERYGKSYTVATEVDPDVSQEYKRQKQYLERSVNVLKLKLGRDMSARKNDNMRIMQENVALIKEINKMRKELKVMHQDQRQRELDIAQTMPSRMYQTDWDEKEAAKILDLQRNQIRDLRAQIEAAHSRLLHFGNNSNSSNSTSLVETSSSSKTIRAHAKATVVAAHNSII
jgi:hypothetical protein